jgi:putative sugar O-methyltransferase
MTDWAALTARTLAGIETCAPIYRPTNFWGPGVRRLLGDLETNGLETFKSWSTAGTWFYPTYGQGFTHETIETTFDAAVKVNPTVGKAWFSTALTGAYQARRDFDAARLAWDQSRWPFDLECFGESQLGRPPQFFRLLESDRTIGWTRPYLNYLLCLAALSRHVDAPPKAFVEIGGGYGVLGEIVMSRDPEARYVNLDLPPLITVSAFYLDALFGDRMVAYDDAIPDTGPLDLSASASLPNWRMPDLGGSFDVFVNSFSFQEMEPDVVEQYAAQVAAKDVAYVVSMNSRAGKHVAADGNEIGVIEPVTSGRIVEMFQAHGYGLLGRYGDPLIQSSGELVVLRRDGKTARPETTLAARPASPSTDYRAAPATVPPRPAPAASTNAAARFARDWLPPRLLRAARRLRARGRARPR